MGLDATDVVKKELERVEGAGGREKHVNSAGIAPHALTGDSGNDPNVGGRNHPNPTLQTLQKMIRMTPAGGVAEKFLERSMGQQRAKDPLAGVHALQKEFGLSWAGDARYQEILRKSMSLEKLDQVIQETGAFVTDHWVYTLVGIAARVWLASKVKDNRKLQRYDVALLLVPLPVHGAEWLEAVNRAAAAEDPAAIEAALDEAQLNFARVLVNLVSVGVAALPRSASAPNATKPRPIKDITPSSAQVPALQAAQPGLIASQLPALARAGRSVQEWIQYWVNVLNGATPLVQLPSVAAVVGELGGLGGLSVFFQEDHSGSSGAGDSPVEPRHVSGPPQKGGEGGAHYFVEGATPHELRAAVQSIVTSLSDHAGSSKQPLEVRAEHVRDWLREHFSANSAGNLVILEAYVGPIERARQRLPLPKEGRFSNFYDAYRWLQSEILAIPWTFSKGGRAIRNEGQEELLLILQEIPLAKLQEEAAAFRVLVSRNKSFPNLSLDETVDIATAWKNALEPKFPGLKERVAQFRAELQEERLRREPPPTVPQVRPFPEHGTDSDRSQWFHNDILLLPAVPNGIRDQLSALSMQLTGKVGGEKKVAALADIYHRVKNQRGTLADSDYPAILDQFTQYQATNARHWNQPSVWTADDIQSVLDAINERRLGDPTLCGPVVAHMFLRLMGRHRTDDDLTNLIEWFTDQRKQLPEHHEGPKEPSLILGQQPRWDGVRDVFPPLAGVYPEDMVRALQKDGFDPVIVTPSGENPLNWLARMLEDVSPRNPVFLVIGSGKSRHFVLATDWVLGKDDFHGRVTYYDPEPLDKTRQIGNVVATIPDFRRENRVVEDLPQLAVKTHFVIVPRAKVDGDAPLIGSYDGPLPRARGLGVDELPNFSKAENPREAAHHWMVKIISSIPDQIRPRTGEPARNQLRTKYLDLINDRVKPDNHRIAAEILLERLRRTQAVTLEEAFDAVFFRSFVAELEKRDALEPPAERVDVSVDKPKAKAEQLRKLTLDGRKVWAPLSNADLKLMQEFIKRYRENPDKHLPLSSEDVRSYYSGNNGGASGRIESLNNKLQKGSQNSDGSGDPVVIGRIRYYGDAYQPSNRVRMHPPELKLKTPHGDGSNGGFWRFELDSGFSLLSQKEPPTPKQNPGGD